MLRYSGVDTGSPINAWNVAENDSANASPTAPSVTTTVDDTRIVRLFGSHDNESPFTHPGGHTELVDLETGGFSDTDTSLGVAETTQPTAGATGPASWSLGSSEEWVAYTVALAPAGAQLTLDKSFTGYTDADGSGDISAGDTLNYSFTATNTGGTALTGVSIVDPLPGLSALNCTPLQPATLSAGASLSCTADYVVQTSDVGGSIDNTATADSDQTDPVSSSVSTPVDSPLKIIKTSPGNADENGDGLVSEGDTLTYTIIATNEGAQPLTGVTITDNLLSEISCSATQPASLNPGAQLICSGHYVVDNADVLAEQVTNIATADSDQTPEQTATVTTPVYDPGPLAVGVYYFPLPEYEVYDALTSIYAPACSGAPDPDDPIETESSIAILRDGPWLYYDHWEDGYETILELPQQDSTEVWGNGDCTDGFAPGTTCADPADDYLSAGQVIVLSDSEFAGADGDYRVDGVYDYDGRDKFGASDLISAVKANWASGSETLLAGALEVYPTSKWGREYELPIGQDTGTDRYEYVGATIMARADGTVVDIDTNGDGTIDITQTLDEGESYLVDGGLLVGATISASDSVQVDIITGDVCATYEARFFTLFPTQLWSNSYFNPVGTTDAATEVTLYNPGDTPLNVLVEYWTGTAVDQVIITVPAGATLRYLRYQQPSGSGAHYCSTNGSDPNNATCDSDAVFYAVAAIDATGASQTNDWGFTLVPETSLSQQALVGLGIGQDPTIPQTENSSPVWVTADTLTGVVPGDGTIEVCVDYNNDGGPLTDAATGLTYDIQISINLLDSVTVYDPDGDQTGMFLFICDECDSGLYDCSNQSEVQNDAIIAVAWGQDPSTASGGSPAIDVGTGVPNVPALTTRKSAVLSDDVNGRGGLGCIAVRGQLRQRQHDGGLQRRRGRARERSR
jgi:uncharacterized repeat protein (TIGR01451 family)